MVLVKLSYSILSAWADHRYEDAVSMYLGRGLPLTPELELGRLKHARWAMHTMLRGTRHRDLGGGKLVNPVVEQRYEKLIPFSDNITILLRGIPDALSDNPYSKGLLYDEYKASASTEAIGFVDSMQAPYMKLLVPEIDEVRYTAWNPYFKTRTIGIRYLTEQDALDALEHIITHGGELISYLQSQRYLRDYSKKYNKQHQTVLQGV